MRAFDFGLFWRCYRFATTRCEEHACYLLARLLELLRHRVRVLIEREARQVCPRFRHRAMAFVFPIPTHERLEQCASDLLVTKRIRDRHIEDGVIVQRRVSAGADHAVAALRAFERGEADRRFVARDDDAIEQQRRQATR